MGGVDALGDPGLDPVRQLLKLRESFGGLLPIVQREADAGHLREAPPAGVGVGRAVGGGQRRLGVTVGRRKIPPGAKPLEAGPQSVGRAGHLGQRGGFDHAPQRIGRLLVVSLAQPDGRADHACRLQAALQLDRGELPLRPPQQGAESLALAGAQPRARQPHARLAGCQPVVGRVEQQDAALELLLGQVGIAGVAVQPAQALAGGGLLDRVADPRRQVQGLQVDVQGLGVLARVPQPVPMTDQDPSVLVAVPGPLGGLDGTLGHLKRGIRLAGVPQQAPLDVQGGQLLVGRTGGAVQLHRRAHVVQGGVVVAGHAGQLAGEQVERRGLPLRRLLRQVTQSQVAVLARPLDVLGHERVGQLLVCPGQLLRGTGPLQVTHRPFQQGEPQAPLPGLHGQAALVEGQLAHGGRADGLGVEAFHVPVGVAGGPVAALGHHQIPQGDPDLGAQCDLIGGSVGQRPAQQPLGRLVVEARPGAGRGADQDLRGLRRLARGRQVAGQVPQIVHVLGVDQQPGRGRVVPAADVGGQGLVGGGGVVLGVESVAGDRAAALAPHQPLVHQGLQHAPQEDLLGFQDRADRLHGQGAARQGQEPQRGTLLAGERGLALADGLGQVGRGVQLVQLGEHQPCALGVHGLDPHVAQQEIEEGSVAARDAVHPRDQGRIDGHVPEAGAQHGLDGVGVQPLEDDLVGPGELVESPGGGHHEPRVVVTPQELPEDLQGDGVAPVHVVQEEGPGLGAAGLHQERGHGPHQIVVACRREGIDAGDGLQPGQQGLQGPPVFATAGLADLLALP